MTKFLTKTFALLLALTIVSCGGSSSKKQSNDGNEASTSETKVARDKKLPFERGSYVEEQEAMGIGMNRTVYFDKWGDWKATEEKSELSFGNYVHKTHKMEITKGNQHWQLDLIERTGTYYEMKVYDSGMGAAIAAALSGKVTEGMEIKDLGEEVYLGYKCKKIKVIYPAMNMEGTMLTYENMNMQMDIKMGIMDVNSKVISIDLNAPPASVFEIPEDIVFEAVNEL